LKQRPGGLCGGAGNKGVGSLFLATQRQLIKTPDPFYPPTRLRSRQAGLPRTRTEPWFTILPPVGPTQS